MQGLHQTYINFKFHSVYVYVGMCEIQVMSAFALKLKLLLMSRAFLEGAYSIDRILHSLSRGRLLSNAQPWLMHFDLVSAD